MKALSLILLGVFVMCVVLAPWLDRRIVENEKATRDGARERLLRSERAWRKPLTFFVHRLILPAVCLLRGHDWDYAAFLPVRSCKRCRKADPITPAHIAGLKVAIDSRMPANTIAFIDPNTKKELGRIVNLAFQEEQEGEGT